MNKTKIEWCDYTWNPVTGCLHNQEQCAVSKDCYARKMAKRFNHGDFSPTIHYLRLDQPRKVKKAQRVFVSSMGDLFGEWVPDEWIEQVFKACEAAPQHTYYFLTKNYDRIKSSQPIGDRFTMNNNWWEGESIAGGDKFFNGGSLNQFVSCEPVFEPIEIYRSHETEHDGCQWVIVGAQSNPTILPKKKWLLDIRDQCKSLGIPLFEKNSLAPLDLPGGLIQEWPE